jgi:hypothetical protein
VIAALTGFSLIVIASQWGRECAPVDAKQSIMPHKERMDCFVARAPRNDDLTTRYVMAGHSRPKDGVAPLAYARPSIRFEFLEARWIRGSSPRMMAE